jgi:LacI family kdg operon repressor
VRVSAIAQMPPSPSPPALTPTLSPRGEGARAAHETHGRATIADVAEAAGVSKATVSRFLNHRERLLSPDIAARVEVAIAALQYSPSPMAQALSHGRSRLIGLIVADITNPYSVAVLRGAEKACQDAGYLVMLFNLGNESEREREAIDALAGYQVDGFILNTLGRGSNVVDAVTLHGKPAVLVDRRHTGMHTDFVSLDNHAAMKDTCGHLVDGGYRELLYVTEPQKGVSSRRERTAAFGACVAAHEPRVAGEIFECVEGGSGRSTTPCAPCASVPSAAAARRWWPAMPWSPCAWRRRWHGWAGSSATTWASSASTIPNGPR